jgi:hypothetical protein
MVKETKFFRKLPDKTERMARAASDAEVSEGFLSLAKAYRSQADVLKMAKKKSGKKTSVSGSASDGALEKRTSRGR